MKYYSIYHTKAFASNLIERFLFGWVSILTITFFTLIILLVGFLTQNYWPAGVLLFSIIYFIIVIYLFIYKKLRDPKEALLLSDNYAEHFDYHISKTLAHYFPKKLTYSQLFKSAVESPRGKFILNRLGLNNKELVKKVRHFLHVNQENLPPIENFLDILIEQYPKWGEKRIDANIILWNFFKQENIFTQILNQANLDIEDLYQIILWESFYNVEYLSRLSNIHPIILKKNLGSFGRKWTIGYTNALDEITDDLTEGLDFYKENKVILHKDSLNRALEVISKASRNNILLLGGVGVGKKTFIKNLAKIIKDYQIKNNQNLSRVLKLHVTDLMSGMSDSAGFLLNALNYAERSGNIILVIEGISDLFRQTNGDIRNIINKFLESSYVSVIGVDNLEGYHMGIKNFPGIDAQFDKINLDDCTDDEIMKILMLNSLEIESKSKVKITYLALKSILNFSKRYISKGAFPGKALNVLTDSVNSIQGSSQIYIKEEDIRSTIGRITNINLNAMQSGEKDSLVELENNLQKEIKGQNEALNALSNALKRAKLDVKKGDKPIGTFLLLGPTGVGKTETAKALAEHYFGSKDRMIRLDMNEFSEAESVYGIIGSPAGQETRKEGFLTRQVQDNPFSLILLDELEKAHKNVLNLFLQILDEGMMTDSSGSKTDFRNTIIIATSNAGAIFLRNYVKNNQEFDKNSFKDQLLDEIINSGVYSPEFLNRFTAVLVYYPLKPEHVADIAEKMINNMSLRFQNERGIALKVSDDAISYIAKKGYSIDFGARELERTITNILETYLADYMLNHNIGRGDAIIINLEDIQ